MNTRSPSLTAGDATRVAARWRPSSKRWRLAAAVALTGLLVAACGDDDDTSDTADAGSSSSADTAETGGAGDAAYEPAEISIAVDGFTLGAPVFVGIENGHFEDVGLTVNTTTFQTGVEGIQAMAGGQVDFAFGLDFAVLSSASENISILGGVASPEPGFHQLAFADGIEEPDDLAGGTMGVVSGTAEEFVSIKWLEQHGLDDQVDTVGLPGLFELVSALKTGEVQAGFVWANGVDEIEADSSLSIVGDDADVLETQGIYLLSTTELAESDPELVARVLTALDAANEDIAADSDAAAEIVADAVSGDADAIAGSLAISGPGVGFTEAQLDNLLDIQDFLVGTDAIPAGTDVEASLVLDPAREVAGDRIEP